MNLSEMLSKCKELPAIVIPLSVAGQVKKQTLEDYTQKANLVTKELSDLLKKIDKEIKKMSLFLCMLMIYYVYKLRKRKKVIGGQYYAKKTYGVIVMFSNDSNIICRMWFGRKRR